MRKTTPHHHLYAWHSMALSGSRVVVTTEPHCGWFKVPLVKGGSMVPARIWCEQPVDEAGDLTAPETMLCEVDGERRDAEDQWPWLCPRPIAFAEFDYMTRLRRWQRVNAPAEYAAARAPVDHLSTPVLEE